VNKLITYVFTLGSICFCIQSNGQFAPDSRSIRKTTALIIAPGEFDEVAKELSNLYRRVLPEGSVGIVHTEWIEKHASPIPPGKLPEGYETLQPIARVPPWNPETKQGYNYVLAKKIIAFLKKLKPANNLRYVTLLGGCLHIPPSYYVRGKPHPPYTLRVREQHDFYPTDFFYCSPDLDTTADFAVGRLPLRTAEDGFRFIKKLKGWYKSSRERDWFHTAAALSGDVCDTRFEPHLRRDQRALFSSEARSEVEKANSLF